jgi:hypothetical protein
MTLHRLHDDILEVLAIGEEQSGIHTHYRDAWDLLG